MSPQPVCHHVEPRVGVRTALDQRFQGGLDDVVGRQNVQPRDQRVADQGIVQTPEVGEDGRVAGEGLCLLQGVVDVAPGAQVAEGAGEDDLAYLPSQRVSRVSQQQPQPPFDGTEEEGWGPGQASDSKTHRRHQMQ